MIILAVLVVFAVSGVVALMSAYEFRGGGRFSWKVFALVWIALLLIAFLGGAINAHVRGIL